MGKTPIRNPPGVRRRPQRTWVISKATAPLGMQYETRRLYLETGSRPQHDLREYDVVDTPKAMQAAEAAVKRVKRRQSRAQKMRGGAMKIRLQSRIDLEKKNLQAYLEARNRSSVGDRAAVYQPRQFVTPAVRNNINGHIQALLHGRVLEVGCKGTSYVDKAHGVSEVIGLDNSRLLLQFYPHPKRLLFDLDDIARGRPLPFKDGEFNHVVVPFSYVELNNPAAVLKELKRIIAPEGRIILMEIPNAHDWSTKRIFTTANAIAELERAGFRVEGTPVVARGKGHTAHAEMDWEILALTRP